MSSKTNLLIAVLASAVIGAGCAPKLDKPKVSYKEKVEPILETNCKQCHVPGQDGAEKSGFLMDSYDSVMRGTKLGPVVVPESAESSSLYRLVAGKADPSIQMPHGKRSLTKDEISIIKQWIDEGAVQ